MSQQIQNAQFSQELAVWLEDTFTEIMEDNKTQKELLQQINTIETMNTMLPENLMKHILNRMLELTLIVKNDPDVYSNFLKINT